MYTKLPSGRYACNDKLPLFKEYTSVYNKKFSRDMDNVIGKVLFKGQFNLTEEQFQAAVRNKEVKTWVSDAGVEVCQWKLLTKGSEEGRQDKKTFEGEAVITQEAAAIMIEGVRAKTYEFKIDKAAMSALADGNELPKQTKKGLDEVRIALEKCKKEAKGLMTKHPSQNHKELKAASMAGSAALYKIGYFHDHSELPDGKDVKAAPVLKGFLEEVAEAMSSWNLAIERCRADIKAAEKMNKKF
jgi:hypothetical protein